MFQAIWLVWQFTPFSDILFLQSHVLPKFRVRILENPSVDVFKVKKTLQSIENSFSDSSLQNFFFTLIICWGYSLQKEWNYDLPCSKFCKELTFVHILCTDTYPFIISTGIQPENITYCLPRLTLNGLWVDKVIGVLRCLIQPTDKK